jgi:hypothetical protein
MSTSTTSPSAKRVKIRVTGETSCNAAFVATNDTPHMTMAMKEASLASRTGRSEVTRGCLLLYAIFTLNQATAELSCTDVLEDDIAFLCSKQWNARAGQYWNTCDDEPLDQSRSEKPLNGDSPST